MNFNIRLNPKLLLVGLLIAAGVGGYVVKMKDARAAVGVSGLTGKYSCISNRNFAPVMTYFQNGTAGANDLTIFDFDTHTLNTVYFANGNWNTGSVNSSTVTGTGTFTESTGPITGSYKGTTSVTYSDNSTSTGGVNFLLSNSGNTIFFSVDAAYNKAPATGVCQKQ
jgi:hypothetical protein